MTPDTVALDAADAERLAELERYEILDTPPDPAFDRITRLTRAIFDVPMSTVTLIDGHRQWFKSPLGLDMSETPRGPAICNVAIRNAVPMVVQDTMDDDRFRDNPYVTGAPFIRFYAGAPLVMPGGAIVGTLCAMDREPRPFDGRATGILTDLAALVVDEILRRPATPDPAAAAPIDPISASGPAPAASPYRRVLKAGRIAFNGGRSVVDCTVRGMADIGAQVAVSSTDSIPENFKLNIPADNWARACRVTARRDRQLEVVFD